MGTTYVQRFGDIEPHLAIYTAGHRSHVVRCYSPTPEEEISAARSAYARDEIEIEEFERRVDSALAAWDWPAATAPGTASRGSSA